MSIDVQDSIIQAIETITNRQIDSLKLDKTVTAIINTCTDATKNEYRVSYNGGTMTAYAAEGESYSKNASVYVLIPEGDFTKKKIITGRTQVVAKDETNISFVTSTLNNYNIIGSNPIIKQKELDGVNSYKLNDYAIFYSTYEGFSSALGVNQTILERSLKNAEALLISAEFCTRLPKEHYLAAKGKYELIVTAEFKDLSAGNDKDGNAIKTKEQAFVLGFNNMVGNPYKFQTWANQYAIFPIDAENFIRITNISLHSEGFEDIVQDDKANKNGNDIFVRNIKINGLEPITAVNKDGYKLTISMPDGNIFNSTQASETLLISAQLKKDEYNNLSDQTTFYWYKEDNRVAVGSEYWNAYGGAGWKYLKDKGGNYSCLLKAIDNKAFENKYMCIAVYKQTEILKTYFTLYNESVRRDIHIESNLGTKFSFDAGNPTLTCFIDDKLENFEEDKEEPRPDSYYNFVWSKTNTDGQTTIFNTTYEEALAALDSYKAQGGDNFSMSTLVKLTNEVAALKDVEFEKGKNVFTYPVSKIDRLATFKCSVYLKDKDDGEEYNIGSAILPISNDLEVAPEDYHIVIENGDQVFQYNEAGVSPCDERYEQPLQIKPLQCHFYGPSGLEIDSNTYSVYWIVPLSDTLIEKPNKLVLNPATNLQEISHTQLYEMKIKSNYDYSALNNQLTCVVNFEGQEFRQDTNLLFTKIGENGTNGTEIVARLVPKKYPEKLLVWESGNYNNQATVSQPVLEFRLYNRNEIINYDELPKWSIAGDKSQVMTVEEETGKITWKDTETGLVNQIIKTEIKYNSQVYYAFYPIPRVKYYQDNYKVTIDSKKLLRTVLYNSDGRNPLYNSNQGIFLTLGTDEEKYFEWSAEGGQNGDTTTSGLTINCFKDSVSTKYFTEILEDESLTLEEKDERLQLLHYDVYQKYGNKYHTKIEGESLYGIYIKPEAIYSGAYSNNLVHCKIFAHKGDATPEVELWIPIHMSLNIFGLASLNAWDGNKVEINEDGGYVLAPQIGAGEKDNKNRFTGILMGTQQTYDMKTNEIGLFGYNQGRQSIFLNAVDGSATFGLPETQKDGNNNYKQGRIKLIPDGVSEIGTWKIGSRSLYNVVNGDIGAPYSSTVEDRELYVQSIPHDKAGILMSADPPYMSIKGRDLVEKDLDTHDLNSLINPGESFELELNPQRRSLFTIYRHYKENNVYKRKEMVGIGAKGNFYVNSLKSESTESLIGPVGAFGKSVAGTTPETLSSYVGASYAFDDKTFAKFFINSNYKNEQGNPSTSPLYISGTSSDNEMARPIELYGEDIKLYAGTLNSNKPGNSSTKLNLSSTNVLLTRESTNTLSFSSSGINLTNTDNSINIIAGKDKTANKNYQINLLSRGTFNISTKDNKNVNLASYDIDINGNTTITAKQKFIINQNNFKLNIDTATLNLSENNNSRLVFNSETVGMLGVTSGWAVTDTISKGSRIVAKQGFSIDGGLGPLNITNTAGGIKIIARQTNVINDSGTTGVKATVHPYLYLEPEGNGYTGFKLVSHWGSIRTGTSEYVVPDPNAKGSNHLRGLVMSGMASEYLYLRPSNGTASDAVGMRGSYFGEQGSARDRQYLLYVQGQAKVSKDLFANSFHFLSTLSKDCHGNTYADTSVWNHIKTLYDLIHSAYGRADDAYSKAETAQSTANKKLDKSTYDSKVGNLDVGVLADQFYRHYHHVQDVHDRETTSVLGHTHRYDFSLDTGTPKT